MKAFLCAALIDVVLGTCIVHADISAELKTQAEQAAAAGRAWLKMQQQEDGNFGLKMAPAMTGLAVTALCLSGEGDSDEVRKAVDWILTQSQEDGGIYAKGILGGRHIYNTAICLTALYQSGREDAHEAMLNARGFLARAQVFGQSDHNGGFSYEAGGDRPSDADLSNTMQAMEAMTLTRPLEDLREGARVEIDREAAASYLSRLQHRSASNPAAWVDESDANRGGFAYKIPTDRKGILTRNQIRSLNTYGTLTYSGLLSLLYADVERHDPRVRSAMEWALRHWSLEENPGKGDAGVYFFLNVMTKTLTANGEETLTLEDGSRVLWREELLRKLIGLQREEAEGLRYWKNDNNRYWEGNPLLSTCYILIALELALAPEGRQNMRDTVDPVSPHPQ